MKGKEKLSAPKDPCRKYSLMFFGHAAFPNRRRLVMDPADIGLFKLAGQRLAWVDQRQQQLAQNIANANTPGFKPRDLPSFAGALSQAALTQTSPLHIAAAGHAAAAALEVRAARAPGGNAVSIEDELGKVADTDGIQQLVINIEHSYLGMFRTAIGKG
jgi:flagellar basal-body rod protein FlgB